MAPWTNKQEPSSPSPRSPGRRWLLIAEMVLLIGVLAWVCLSLTMSGKNMPDNAVAMKVQLRDAQENVYLLRQSDGQYRFRIHRLAGPHADLTPDEFARRVYQDQNSRTLLSKLLNVSSPWGYVWVGLGLLGQVLFTGRMIVQWIASEKSQRSVVPPSFWWMSLIGATMLLIYFIWRKDAVGVLGQSVGWFIYVRNLWLIYQGKPAEEDSPAPAVPVEAMEPATGAPPATTSAEGI